MQNAAMWLASIFGPFLVILGLWMLIYCDQYKKAASAIKGSAGLLYLKSVFHLLVGFTVLSQYDTWGWNLLALVTLLGWYMVVDGVIGLFAPQLFAKMMSRKQDYGKVYAFIALVWGALLSYAGFFMK